MNLINLKVELQKANKRIRKLEQALQERTEYTNKLATQVQEEQAIRDLEQQAKGIEWVLDCRELNLSDGEFYTIKDKHNNLLEQAAKLKEQEQ